MAPAVGFWCFMDDLNEEMFPFASIDWCETPDVVKGEPSPGKVLSFAKSQLATKQVHQRDAVHDAESIDANVEPVPDNGESSPKKEDNKADQKLKNGTGDKGQQDKTRQTNAPIPRGETLTQEVKPLNSIEHQLFENLSNQNRELLRGKESAIKWQDAASMAIKEAKDEAETRKQETHAAKKTGLRAAAMVQRELNDSKKEVEALKRDKVLVAKNKTRAESDHREEMSVAEGKIEELQTGLHSALDNGRESAKRSNELSQTNKELQNELAAKDKKLADKDEEKQILQGRVDARDSEIQDIRTEAGKDRKACNEYRRETFESEKAQRGAERKVGDLKQEAIKFKAKTDKAMKTLQTKVDESVARETKANARATKAEGDAEQLKRELDNTESARQTFEKKEGEWAALFAANQGGAGTPSQSALVVANAPVSEMGQPVTEQQISNTTANKLEVSKLADGKPERKAKLSKKPEQQAPAPAPAPGLEAQKKITELEGVVEKWKRSWEVAQDAEKAWKQTIRQELNGKYRTAVATAREKIRKELESEKQKALASERKTIREKAKCSLKARLAVRAKSHKSKELQKHRRRTAAEEGKRARSKKGQVEWVFDKATSSTGDADRSQLETKTRNQLQTEFQKELSNHKTQWEVERTAIVGSQLEVQIRNQLQTEYQKELSSFKTQWEIEHSPSKAGLESQKNAAAENQIQMDESGTSGPAAARSPEDDMLLASLSKESDETHEPFQEIGRTGLPHNSGACIVLQELNQAKDAIYDVKCELWKPDAVINKNNLLQLVGVIHVNEHYIRQLDPSTREVLIRQANEANRRLEYVQKNLGTNEDVPKYAMLEALFGSPKPEPDPEHKEPSAPSQTPNASLFPQKPNGLENAAAPGISASTPFGNSALPGTTVFPSVTGLGNPAAPDASAFSLTFNGFGDAAASKRSETSTQGVLNPFENYHFPSQLALDSAPSASQITTKPQESAPIVPSSALLDSSMDFRLDDLSSRGSGQLPIAVTDGKGISAQNGQDSGAPDRTTEANNGHEANFKKTFGPLVPQGEDPAPPPSMNVAASPDLVFNFGDFSSTAPAD